MDCRVACFVDACQSLDELFLSSSDHPFHRRMIDYLITEISPAVLREKSEYVSGPLIQSHWLIVTVGHRTSTCSSSWSDHHVSQLFGILLRFIIADPPLKDVMQGFQETSLLSPASEAIASTFESLPLMSPEFSTKILNLFKPLLALHQPAATRKITDALYLLCLQPTIEVSPEALVDLLCSLATSVSSNEMSGDNLTFTARVLNDGMKKVFSLSRQTCVFNLPVVFSAFKDILASELEEPVSVAAEALKSLIHTCIDQALINEGVDQITESGRVRKSAPTITEKLCAIFESLLNYRFGVDHITESGRVRKSTPTIIEKLCATVESLLDYRFAAVWDMSFQVIAAMFVKLGEFSSYFLRGALKSMEDMQKLPEEDFFYRKQLHDCMGVAVAALGPETFLKLLPLNVEAQHLSDVNTWLFPILRQHIVGARLSFFNESLLDSIRLLKLKSAKHKQEGRIHSARSIDRLVCSVWSLLPSFCNYPVDTAESFKDLATELCHSLRLESDFHGVICLSLQKLIQQNKRIKEGGNEASGEANISQQHAVFLYTSEVAACNLDVLRSSAHEILSTLFTIFMKSSKEDGGSLKITIGEFASIADKSVVSWLFKNIIHELLESIKVTGKVQNPRRVTSMAINNSLIEQGKLYDLAVALLPGLGTKEVDLLFVAVEYELKHDGSFIATRFEELFKLMFEVRFSCPFSAKQRLDCLYLLTAHVLKDNSEQMKPKIVASFVAGIVRGLKEPDKKTRNKAYETIRQIGHACMDENKGGSKEKLYNFFNMVHNAAGLAGETPYIISAAMRGVAHLTNEFYDYLLPHAFNVLPSTFLLLQRKNRKINKRNSQIVEVLKERNRTIRTHRRRRQPEAEMELISPRNRRKVPVVYYLCRNRQLEHPHFIEVALVSPDGLYLRDVIEKFDSVRGRGMASMYSWSCKRSYKNAFVWNDLGEDDLVVPARENEYILKGSELVEEHNSGRFVAARNIKSQNVEQLAESPSSITRDDYSSSTNIIGTETKTSQDDDGKYKIYKSSHGLSDASTQTDEHVKLQETCTRSFLTDNGHVASLTNDSPPSSSGACSSTHKTDTLESLMKADNYHFNTSEKLEEQQEDQDYEVPTNTKIRALLQLISCGSISSQDNDFSQDLSCRSRPSDSKLSSRLLSSSSVMLGELDCLSENPRFMGMKLGDKEYFSGSLVETKSLKNEEISNLKRSSSYRLNECTPRSIMGSLSKHSRSTSMRFCEDPNSCVQSPCISNNGSKRITVPGLAKKPSKRMESFGDNKENVNKIEERARVIIHLEANDLPVLN
ncbi:hypothetical protein SSX86_023464 [Deinandra increscens subsp. villosa]|uniref:Uncharacterized protein n=1 Tax=Deinandra increscens subsp. villosa TaxID=3103831 RepID=A0AAP0CQX6_9ASTR